MPRTTDSLHAFVNGTPLRRPQDYFMRGFIRGLAAGLLIGALAMWLAALFPWN